MWRNLFAKGAHNSNGECKQKRLLRSRLNFCCLIQLWGFTLAPHLTVACGLRSVTGINFHHKILIRKRVRLFLPPPLCLLFFSNADLHPAYFHALDHKSSPDLSGIIPCDCNPLIMTKPLDARSHIFCHIAHTHYLGTSPRCVSPTGRKVRVIYTSPTAICVGC